MLAEILIFSFGIGIGMICRSVLGSLRQGVTHVPVPFNRQYGCSKVIQHICDCVKPHGHESDHGEEEEIRWHMCEHGSIRVTDQATRDLN